MGVVGRGRGNTRVMGDGGARRNGAEEQADRVEWGGTEVWGGGGGWEWDGAGEEGGKGKGCSPQWGRGS